MKETVYIIIKDGYIYNAKSNANVDIVVLDYDTQDEDMIHVLDQKVTEIENLPEIEIY